MICKNLTQDAAGNLLFAGIKPRTLLEQFGSPLYAMDENLIRENCRAYYNGMHEAFGDNCEPLYASKACSFLQMYRIIKEEKLGIDVVSVGEINTAKTAGFDMSRAYFHSNNKSDADIRYAMDAGVGTFVVDCTEELTALSRIAGQKGITQNILLRITPGIDTHTYEAVNTGKVDSKFGSPIETGQAEQIAALALQLKNIKLCGFHCHVGSQVFGSDVFIRSADIMLDFIAEIRDTYGYTAEILDLGGGYGVRYEPHDPKLDLAKRLNELGEAIRAKCAELEMDVPKIILEPGRSIVADAGMTVYTVGSVKRIPGYKNYISVDGGMTDNPRYALYQAVHGVVLPEHMNEKPDTAYSIVGQCCESGDILRESVPLPSNVKRGDVLAVLTTGAYCYSMASHYNRIPNLPVIMIADGKPYVAVRRETVDDIIHLDV